MRDAAPTFRIAAQDDAAAIAHVRTEAANALTSHFGQGHWSNAATERGVLAGYRHSYVFVAMIKSTVVGTMRLSTRKPWAIDRVTFTPVARPLYLTDMAVDPKRQRQGIGRACLAEADRIAAALPAQAIWLDAYDAPAGAGRFYAACGYRECGRRIYRGTPLVYFERAVTSCDAQTDSPAHRR